MRDTYITAMNKPKLFVGIERRMLVVSFFISLLIGIGNSGLWHALAGVVLFLILCVVSMWLTRKDDRLLPIWLSIHKQKGLYDPGKRANDIEVQIC